MTEATYLTPLKLDGIELLGAAYDQRRRLVFQSLRHGEFTSVRHRDPAYLMETEIEETEDAGEQIYLGHYFEHYGHFLLETMPMLAHVLDTGKRGLFLDFTRFGIAGLDRFLSTLKASPTITVYGGSGTLRGSFTIAPRPIAINWKVLDHSPYRMVLDRLADICRPSSSSPERVFLKRKATRVTEEEAAKVEQDCISSGFTMIDPDKLPLAEQIAIMRGAREVAGFSGSQMHNAIFCREGTIIKEFGDTRTAMKVGTNQALCCEISGSVLEFVPFVGAPEFCADT